MVAHRCQSKKLKLKKTTFLLKKKQTKKTKDKKKTKTKQCTKKITQNMYIGPLLPKLQLREFPPKDFLISQ